MDTWNGGGGGDLHGVLVPYPHTYPHLFYKRRVRDEEGLDRGPHIIHSMVVINLEACLDLMSNRTNTELARSWFRRSGTLVSMRHQVLGDIQSW